MRNALILAACAGFVTAGSAEARPDTRSMTCRQAQNLVYQRGAIVLSTGTHTFDRYVAGPGFCEIGERIVPETVPTKDTARCPIGYICEAGSPMFDFDR